MCKKPGCYRKARKTHVRDRIFKLKPNSGFVNSLNSLNFRFIWEISNIFSSGLRRKFLHFLIAFIVRIDPFDGNGTNCRIGSFASKVVDSVQDEFYSRIGERMKCLILTVLIGVIVVVTLICEECFTYRRKGNVTIDTRDCLFVNSILPMTTYGCLDSCTSNITVSTFCNFNITGHYLGLVNNNNFWGNC